MGPQVRHLDQFGLQHISSSEMLAQVYSKGKLGVGGGEQVWKPTKTFEVLN